MRRAARLALAVFLAGFLAGEAKGDVVLGHDVFIAGHDFSHQRYKSITVTTTRQKAPWSGCRIVPAGAMVEGRALKERTRVCYLTKRRRLRTPG